MASMFEGCTAENIDVSSFDTTNVVMINRMFFNTRTKALYLSNFNIENVVFYTDVFGESTTPVAYVGTKEDEKKWLEMLYKN